MADATHAERYKSEVDAARGAAVIIAEILDTFDERTRGNAARDAWHIACCRWGTSIMAIALDEFGLEPDERGFLTRKS